MQLRKVGYEFPCGMSQAPGKRAAGLSPVGDTQPGKLVLAAAYPVLQRPLLGVSVESKQTVKQLVLEKTFSKCRRLKAI